MKSVLKELLFDTLKKDGHYNSLRIMRFIGFNLCMFIFMADYFSKGFRLESWITVIGFAFGTRLIDAQSKKLEK
tara:strand:- start:11970 stop:12191 length:222 start_codon:yes stop_codon:yes gene_type:complete